MEELIDIKEVTWHQPLKRPGLFKRIRWWWCRRRMERAFAALEKVYRDDPPAPEYLVRALHDLVVYGSCTIPDQREGIDGEGE
jgi:hypothetical protein